MKLIQKQVAQLQGVKFVPSTIIVGPHGLPQVTRGYMEIGGVRLYEDRMVIGRYGQPVIERGGFDAGRAALSEGEKP